MSLLYESMTRLKWGAWTVRVWREQSDPWKADNSDLFDLTNELVSSSFEIVRQIMELPGVNAVEVLDRHHCGTVVYKDWP